MGAQHLLKIWVHRLTIRKTSKRDMLIRREFCEGNIMTPNYAQKALLRLTESAVSDIRFTRK